MGIRGIRLWGINLSKPRQEAGGAAPLPDPRLWALRPLPLAHPIFTAPEAPVRQETPPPQITGPAQMFYEARISIRPSESSDSPVRRLTLTSADKGAFTDTKLIVRTAGVIRRGTRKVMLVTIDPRRNEVLLLDWDGRKVTLEMGKPAKVGTGNCSFCLEDIAWKETGPFDKHPPRPSEETEFMKSHITHDWWVRYIVY